MKERKKPQFIKKISLFLILLSGLASLWACGGTPNDGSGGNSEFGSGGLTSPNLPSPQGPLNGGIMPEQSPPANPPPGTAMGWNITITSTSTCFGTAAFCSDVCHITDLIAYLNGQMSHAELTAKCNVYDCTNPAISHTFWDIANPTTSYQFFCTYFSDPTPNGFGGVCNATTNFGSGQCDGNPAPIP